MNVEKLCGLLRADFFAGVPDSQLSALCVFLTDRYGLDPSRHVVAANEGNAVALAAGYHLATGKTPVVYLQNSGLGNIVNPVASLLNSNVCGIPCLFIVGWRGEPGVHDEPQHIFQGEITLNLLKLLSIPFFILDKTTSENDVEVKMREYHGLFSKGGQAAFVVKKGALTYAGKTIYNNTYTISRENAIRHIAAAADDGVLVVTTGKAGRETFEHREAQSEGHAQDFLAVGAMGHCSSVALEIALQKKDRRVWCLDGDGAALMHMGAMAVIGAARPDNLIHIVLNNEAHESVGGMPTAAKTLNFHTVARACGYPAVMSADTPEGVIAALNEAKKVRKLTFIEIKCALGAREDLGRPTVTPEENKRAFMDYLYG